MNLHRPATRLTTGSHRLATGALRRTRRWVGRGRRDDLTGWKSAIGCWVRAGLLLGAAYLLARAIRATPAIMWLLTGLWLTAAWRTGRDATEEPAEHHTAEPDTDAVVRLLRDLLAGAPAVHLSTALTHLQKHGHGEGWKVTDLRARLEALGIPVHPKVKVGGIPTRGVRATDLDRVFPTQAPPAEQPR